jgi:hypothetical protein
LLTFDGQTEVITSNLGYSPLRLYSLSRELLTSSEPVELSNEGEEDGEPCTSAFATISVLVLI